jgi:hypothetical protein
MAPVAHRRFPVVRRISGYQSQHAQHAAPSYANFDGCDRTRRDGAGNVHRSLSKLRDKVVLTVNSSIGIFLVLAG